MTPDADLSDLARRFREGDANAMAELARRYEPDIRRIARIRLARFGLRHIVDSEDIAQSVMGRFFARVRSGDVALESPEKLIHFLSVIATNRITTYARREWRQVRPTGANEEDHIGLEHVPDAAPPVDRLATVRDQLAWVLRVLNQEDRELLLQRALGRGWAELALERGVGAEALRKRLNRALDAAGIQLGLDETSA